MVFFEARKRKDLYLWVAKAPEGPSVKFHIENGEGRPCTTVVTAAMQRSPIKYCRDSSNAEEPHQVQPAYPLRDMTAKCCLQCTRWQSSSSAGIT